MWTNINHKKTFSDDVHNEAPVSCLSAHIPVLLAIVQDIYIHIFEGTSSQAKKERRPGSSTQIGMLSKSTQTVSLLNCLVLSVG